MFKLLGMETTAVILDINDIGSTGHMCHMGQQYESITWVTGHCIRPIDPRYISSKTKRSILTVTVRRWSVHVWA